MDRDRERQEREDADWIFASDDPHTLPTDRLPDREEFDRYAAPLLARRAGQPALPGENETADLSGIGADDPRAQGPAADEPDTATGLIPALDPDGEESEDPHPAGAAADPQSTDTGPEQDRATAPLRPPREVTYARSGTTPSAEDEDEAPTGPGGFSLPDRFKALGVFDALRDVLALICLVSALNTTFTLGSIPAIEGYGKAAIGTGLLALIAVHLLRWIPQHPPLVLVRLVRIIGLLPALLTAIAVILADLVTSLPLLFASLPEGPPVGLGVGVSLLLLGSIVGIEPRAHEGYLPAATARRRARMLLLAVTGAAAAGLLLALVMIGGRVITTGWSYSLMALGSTIVSAVLLTLVLSAALRRDLSRYVFSTAAVGGLVVAAFADNTLRLQFAGTLSFATGYVYLPLLLAAFGLMISRSFVRTVPISFRRADWLVYTVRAFEFSAMMHAAAVVWHVLAVIASRTGDAAPGGQVVHLLGAAVCACFAAVSLFGRRALLERPADLARASGVVAGIVLVVVGFLAVIVNSLAMGAGAGLVTGGAALAFGVATALMLTVPAPVRDEFGAPDLVKMFADFRRRDAGRSSVLDRVPDVTEERTRKKPFPSR